MTNLDKNSPEYTLDWLIELWYLTHEDLKEALSTWKSEDEVVKAVTEILLND